MRYKYYITAEVQKVLDKRNLASDIQSKLKNYSGIVKAVFKLDKDRRDRAMRVLGALARNGKNTLLDEFQGALSKLTGTDTQQKAIEESPDSP